MFMLNLELNIASCTISLVHTMKEIGKKYGVQTFHHGWDHLVFDIDFDSDYVKMMDELKDVAHEAGIKFNDLIV